MIGERFNFEDVFFRDLTVCVLDTLEGEVRWVNKFSSGDRVINVPFYYSMTGDERFLLDSFTDDVVSNSRYVDLNTDIIPRGHLTLTSYEIRGDEFANPNVWLKMVVENETEIRNMLTKVRAIPITVKYDLVILLSSEIDTFKCSQAIMDTLWLYRFMYFEHNFMNIDAVMQIPDSNNIEINREKSLTSDNTIKLTVSFDVQTYYPAYRKPKLPDVIPFNFFTPHINRTLNLKVDLLNAQDQLVYSEYQNITTSSDGSVLVLVGSGAAIKGSYLNVNLKENGLKIQIYSTVGAEGENYDILEFDGDLEPSSSNVDSNLDTLNEISSNSYSAPTPNGDFRDIIILPKRTRWYNNLLITRGSGATGTKTPYNSENINNQKKI
jgi:hypothetical protein